MVTRDGSSCSSIPRRRRTLARPSASFGARRGRPASGGDRPYALAPVEESWKDASIPLPATRQEEEAEYTAREAAEVREAELEGAYDWHVVIHLPHREDAVVLAERLATEGRPVRRRWRYLVADAVTEEDAQKLADRIHSEVPGDADVRIEVDLSDLARSPLQFLPF